MQTSITTASAIYEKRLSQLLIAFLGSGMLFLLGPGSFLGLWNLFAISHQRTAGAISPAWLQAHGHAEVYGWVGSFILGIGFHSLVRLRGARLSLFWGWASWWLWTLGVGLRWLGGVVAWHWRVMLPASAGLELVAFAIFQTSISRAHRDVAKPIAAAGSPSRVRQPGWVLLVLTGAGGLLLTLGLNFGVDLYLAIRGLAPAYPSGLDERLVELMAWAFLTPFVWGFSMRWLPVFAGLRPSGERTPRLAAAVVGGGTLATLAGANRVAAACWLGATLMIIAGLHLWERAAQPAKIVGIHPSFRFFLRLAYAWLLLAAGLGLGHALAPQIAGVVGASRHALTVGFVAAMVLTIGPRILPAFSGMRVLYSPRLMLTALLLLHLGCVLRVSGEVLAYSGWLPWAWHWLPLSAALEVGALTVFAYNLIRTLLQPPAHLMRQRQTVTEEA